MSRARLTAVDRAMTATIRRTDESWEILLTDPAEVAFFSTFFSTPWIPLPLTAAASADEAIAHVLALGPYSAVTVK